MNTAEIRNETHAAKRATHAQNRAHVLAALVSAAAPISTRALAARMTWDVLAVRPRVTELVQAGLVVLDGKGPDGGLYRAATVQETLSYQSTLRPAGAECQQELPFTSRRPALRSLGEAGRRY